MGLGGTGWIGWGGLWYSYLLYLNEDEGATLVQLSRVDGFTILECGYPVRCDGMCKVEVAFYELAPMFE